MTLRGVQIPLVSDPYKSILGIVVIDVFNAGGKSIVDQLEIHSGLIEVRGIPVHVFRACDFRTIAREQDTIPDLLNYLTTRQELLGGDIRVPLVAELDLWPLQDPLPANPGVSQREYQGVTCGARVMGEGS